MQLETAAQAQACTTEARVTGFSLPSPASSAISRPLRMASPKAFDYVIVGAGSAGCVLASRLSEDAGTRVLVLEAGGPDRARELRIPAAFAKNFKTERDWAYYTEPEPNLAGRRLYWPRGRVLGGSSAINAMIYIRGNPGDYDAWAAAGCTGWDWASVLPVFKRSEDNSRGASDYHGAGGPLRVEDLRCLHPLSERFLGAAVALGYRRNPDFNGPRQEGFGYYQVTQKRGRRWSAADAWLKPALGRANLRVVTGALATRVVFEGRRATGVEYVSEGQRHIARAEREVILCGGAVNSPQLLLLSGVGPAEELQELGIPVLHDLPGVGRNLHDHLLIVTGFAARRTRTLDDAATFSNLLCWMLFRSGPLTSNLAEAGGFVRLRDPVWPDVQLLFGPVQFIEHGFTRLAERAFGAAACVLRPRSRGRLRLRSADPAAPPRVEPNYLAEPADLELMVAGAKLAHELLLAPVFDGYRGEYLQPERRPRTDAEWAEFIRRKAETNYHPVGSCKMGVDTLAVVDPELRVRGLEALRVADASVMPSIPSGNTNAPAIMIAERAAELIRTA